jgi:hypothetical protein
MFFLMYKYVYFASFHKLNDEMNVVLKIPSVFFRHVFIMFVYCMTSTKHGSTQVNYCTFFLFYRHLFSLVSSSQFQLLKIHYLKTFRDDRIGVVF